MSLTVKASLYNNWHFEPIETRRFSLDQEVATSYTYLVQKLAQIFDQLEADKIIVSYIDTDGDRVTISSDDELTEALSQFDGNIFRLLIKKKKTDGDQPFFPWQHHHRGNRHHGNRGRQGFGPFFSGWPFPPQQQQQQQQPPQAEADKKEDEPNQENKETNQGPQHPGVVCDGCQGSIFGVRYKCCQCIDYDLCSNCEQKGIHSDHNMYTIERPRQWGGCPLGFGNRQFWSGQGQFGPFDFQAFGHPGRCGPWGTWGTTQCRSNCSQGGARGDDKPEETNVQTENQDVNIILYCRWLTCCNNC
jgi:sequestosome 1